MHQLNNHVQCQLHYAHGTIGPVDWFQQTAMGRINCRQTTTPSQAEQSAHWAGSKSSQWNLSKLHVHLGKLTCWQSVFMLAKCTQDSACLQWAFLVQQASGANAAAQAASRTGAGLAHQAQHTRALLDTCAFNHTVVTAVVLLLLGLATLFTADLSGEVTDQFREPFV